MIQNTLGLKFCYLLALVQQEEPVAEGRTKERGSKMQKLLVNQGAN